MTHDNLSQIDLSILNGDIHDKEQRVKTLAIIRKHLTDAEIIEIDFRFLGNIVLSWSRALSIKVSRELLEPIFQWQNDNKWRRRLTGNDDQKYDWAFYKRQQRMWTRQQKRLAAERLKLFRKAILRKRNIREKMSPLSDKPNLGAASAVCLEDGFIKQIVSPFCPTEQRRRKTNELFHRARSLSVADLLPWKTMIREDLIKSDKTNIAELKTYYSENKKRDTVSKLIHLLELEQNGELELTQKTHFGNITIRSTRAYVGGAIVVTDQDGNDYHFDWLELNSRQRSRLIEDVKERKILCRATASK